MVSKCSGTGIEWFDVNQISLHYSKIKQQGNKKNKVKIMMNDIQCMKPNFCVLIEYILCWKAQCKQV